MTSDSKTLFLLLLLLCVYPAAAQKLTFHQLGVRQGLPASEVYNLHQDQKGYVWAFTEYGIVKHNGTRFMPACTGLPFSESAIYKVAESASGELYVANSHANIYRIVGDSAILIKGLEKISAEILEENQTILHLLVDDSSNIWFSTHNKSYKFSVKTNRIEALCGDKPRKNEIIFKVVGNRQVVLKCIYGLRDKECTLTITGRNNKTLFSIPYRYFYEGRNAIVKSGDLYYIMTADGVVLTGPGGETKSVKFGTTTLDMQLAPDGHIWLGMAYGGLYELSADLEILHHYLDGVAVSDIMFDDQAGMWVSTIGRGVYYCRNRQSVSYDEIPELSDCISMLKVIGSKLFIGTDRGQLFVRENGQLRQIDLKGNRFGINDVILLDGTYFIGTKISILEADAGLKKVKVSVSLSAYSFGKRKNAPLLAVSGSRIIEKQQESYVDVIATQKPRWMAIRFGNEVFISTRQGLFILKKTLVCPKYLEPLQGKNIAKLRVDSRENIWICTKGEGLYMLTPNNQLRHYDKIPSVVTTDIRFLRNNGVLLSTNKGAYISTLKNGGFSTWIQLIDEETVSIEQFEDQFFIGTKLGLRILNVSDLIRPPVYRFYLRSVLAGGKMIPTRNIRLSHDQNDLYFNFDLLAYHLNERHLFYELEGPSPGKGVVNGTQLHLQNLVPGCYTLHTYPINHQENIHQKGITLTFYIAPAFWQTNWFIGTVVFLLVTLIVLVIWQIFSRGRTKADQRSRITKLLAGYRLTALKAQINPHFISNSLSAIQQLILTDQTDRANQYMAKFSLLIRYLLNYSDKAVASLGSEIRIIDLDIDLEQLRFSNKFVFRKEIAENVDPELLYIPPLITQPFIENAIWHGLLPLTGDRVPELVLEVTLEENKLMISIIDNGVGRPKEIREQSKASTLTGERESKGTELIRNRIDNLNLLHTTTNGAVIEFIDLEDPEGNPTGTRVNIIFSIDMLNKLYDEQDQEHYY